MSTNSLRASLKAVSAFRREAHPSPEQLLAYHLGELEAAAAEVAEQHIALCSECALHVLDMDRFLTGETSADAERGNDFDVEHLMRSVKEALAADQTDSPAVAEAIADEPNTSPGSRGSGEPDVPLLTTLGFARAAAVFFSITATVLAGYIVSSRDGSAEGVDSTMANVPVFELTTSETRGPGERDQIGLSGTAPGALLVFPLAAAPAFVRYELTIETLVGELVFRRSDLQRTAGGLLTLVVPRELFSAGSYRVAIHGLDESTTANSLADFEFDWQPE